MLTEIDREALTRAFETSRQDPVQRRWIEERFANGQSWEDVARSCACECQHRALDLMPWQLPPISPTIAAHLDDVLREPFNESGRRESAEVLKKMLALGISAFEPDPFGAIIEAERARMSTAK